MFSSARASPLISPDTRHTAGDYNGLEMSLIQFWRCLLWKPCSPATSVNWSGGKMRIGVRSTSLPGIRSARKQWCACGWCNDSRWCSSGWNAESRNNKNISRVWRKNVCTVYLCPTREKQPHRHCLWCIPTCQPENLKRTEEGKGH